MFPDIINSTKISNIALEIQSTVNSTLIHTQEFLEASIISTLFILVYWSIIYMDSYRPGKLPPSPLSVFDKERYLLSSFNFSLIFFYQYDLYSFLQKNTINSFQKKIFYNFLLKCFYLFLTFFC